MKLTKYGNVHHSRILFIVCDDISVHLQDDTVKNGSGNFLQGSPNCFSSKEGGAELLASRIFVTVLTEHGAVSPGRHIADGLFVALAAELYLLCQAADNISPNMFKSTLPLLVLGL